MNLINFLPFSYFYTTRIKDLNGLLRYFLSYFGFCLISTFLLNPNFCLKEIVIYSISYAGYIAIYELGYLYNDCISIHLEENPKIRLDRNSCDISFLLFYLYRIVFFLIVIILLLCIVEYDTVKVYIYGILTIAAIFYVHNNLKILILRSVTFSMLGFLSFWVPMSSIPINSISFSLAIILFILPSRVLGYLKSKYLIFIDLTVKIKIALLVCSVSICALGSIFYEYLYPLIFVGMYMIFYHTCLLLKAWFVRLDVQVFQQWKEGGWW